MAWLTTPSYIYTSGELHPSLEKGYNLVSVSDNEWRKEKACHMMSTVIHRCCGTFLLCDKEQDDFHVQYQHLKEDSLDDEASKSPSSTF